MIRKTTELDRAADILQRDGYLLGWMHEDREAGIVAFFDPHTLRMGWNGKRVFGLVRFSGDEIRRLRNALDASTQILHKVREAEIELLEGLKKGKGLGGFGVSLIFTLLVVSSAVSHL